MQLHIRPTLRAIAVLIFGLGLLLILTGGLLASLEVNPSPSVTPALAPHVYLPLVFKNYCHQTRGIPYGAGFFGMVPDIDYNAETLAVFSGASLSLYNVSPANVETLLSAAKDNCVKVMVIVGESNPCRYWNSNALTFDYDLFMADAAQQIKAAARYVPNTLVAVSLLNEPHWINKRTSACYSGVPPKYLYNLVKRVREAFAAEGVTDPNFLIGVNSHPSYIDNSIGFPNYIEPPEGGQLTEAEKQDGTINLLWIYYHGGDTSWAKNEQQVAKKLGTRIVYNANADKAGSGLGEVGAWHCQQEHAAFVTYWHWGRERVPLSDLIPVRRTCDGNIAATPTYKRLQTENRGSTWMAHAISLESINCLRY